MAAPATDEGRVALAAVAGAHGIQGEVRLKLFTDSAERLADHARLFVGGVERRLIKVRGDNKGAVARFEGVSGRNEAEALRGSLVEIDRAELPPLAEGEYYHAELIGLLCLDGDGRALGSVIAVENFGAGDLLEVVGEGGRKSLIPFKAGIADLVEGHLVLDPDFLA